MAQINIDSRTIHTIQVQMPDDIMGKLVVGDEVEVVLTSRYGNTLPRKLSYSDLLRLLEGVRKR